MVYLIIGTPDSGKSKLAEELADELSGHRAKYYIATMIPYGEEGAKRVEKHRAMRAGKGFTTLEMPFDAGSAVLPYDCVALLECVSNLAANEMFDRHTPPDQCEDKIAADICRLQDSVSDLVIVTNHFGISEEFDEETVRYALLMDRINHRLSVLADRVIDLTAGR